ncbi:MAG: EipB family protein [Rhizobiaceae bacterium]
MKSLKLGSMLSLSLAFVFSTITAPLASGFGLLAPHRAIYELSLKDASERSGIKAMKGRIVYEVTGGKCEGMAIQYRFLTNITTSDGSYQTDQQTTTYESPDGKEFNFLTRTFVDERPERVVGGAARRTDDGVKVDLNHPEPRELDLPDAIFISTHLANIIRKAKDGERLVYNNVFDGSDDADEVVSSSSIIGNAKVFDTVMTGETDTAVEELRPNEAWPVTISYYDKKADASSESLPIYEASFLLYGNGVSRKLQLRYPDYALSGQLSSLEILEATDCD